MIGRIPNSLTGRESTTNAFKVAYVELSEMRLAVGFVNRTIDNTTSPTIHTEAIYFLTLCLSALQMLRMPTCKTVGQ